MRVSLKIRVFFLLNFVTNSGKFRHGTSIVATCSPPSSTKVDSQFDKLATVVGRATVDNTCDGRQTTLSSLSHSASISVFSTMHVKQRVARVHLRH